MSTLLSSSALPWYQQIRPSRSAAPASLPCIDVALEQQAALAPKKVALVDESGYLSYADLRRAIHARAAVLLQRGAGEPQSGCAGVLLENGIHKVITYFACLKAGLAYTPLDGHPPAVVERILERVPLRALITSKGRATALPSSWQEGDAVFRVEDEVCRKAIKGQFPGPDPLKTAHITFTSGTQAGLPKGVETDHAGSMLSHAWRSRLWPYDRAGDVVGCNIFGIWDVVPALCRGVPVVLIPDQTMRDPFALGSFIIRYGITRLMMTPTLLDACLASADGVAGLRRLRLLVLCGGVVAPAGARRAGQALPGVRIGNLYSLAECHDVAAGELEPGETVTSGRVADFAEVHLCDPDDPDCLVPVGRAGRILVGGKALAHGYYRDSERTTQHFFELDLPSPDGACRRTRVYDTGDLGRLHPGGTLEILGRCDARIKIRGSWVDPSEVEQVVEQHPVVRRACVTARPDSLEHAELSAFVVAREADISAASLTRQLRPYVATRLPEHSLPGRFIPVRQLPLLPSGKVDRHRLQTLEQAAPSQPPQDLTGLEEQVVSAFRETLGDPTIGRHDDFHARGGHSLRAILLCGALHRTTGRRIGVRDVYLHPTPSTLARHLRAQREMQPRTPWHGPELDLNTAPPPRPRRARPDRPRTVLLTGATGFLGAFLAHTLLEATSMRLVALVRAEDTGHAHQRLQEAFARYALPDVRDPGRRQDLQALPGDLAKPLMGLDPETFEDLAGKVDVILHLAAALDLFAAYEDVEPVNVGGTREVVRLAGRGHASVHCVSSSAVFPLGGHRSWAEDTFGLDAMRPLAADLEASGADGYSLSKFAAEMLIWSAFDQGLPVSVVRVPHLLGHSEKGIRNDRDRLVMTLRALVRAGVFPEGDWTWQFAPVDVVCRELVSRLHPEPSGREPVRHVALEPLHAAQVLEGLQGLGIELDLLPVPALANAIIAAAQPANQTGENDPKYRAVGAVAQLIHHYGPRAALNLSDAQLGTRHPCPGDPATLFRATLGSNLVT